MEKQEFTEGQVHEAMIRLRGVGLTPKGLQRLIEDKEKAESVVALLEENGEEKSQISTEAFKIAKDKAEEKKRREAEHKRKKHEERKTRAAEILSRCQPILEFLERIGAREDLCDFLRAADVEIRLAKKGSLDNYYWDGWEVQVYLDKPTKHGCLYFTDYNYSRDGGYQWLPLTKEALKSYAEDWANDKNKGKLFKVLQKLTQEQARKRITKKLKRYLGKDYKKELISI